MKVGVNIYFYCTHIEFVLEFREVPFCFQASIQIESQKYQEHSFLCVLYIL